MTCDHPRGTTNTDQIKALKDTDQYNLIQSQTYLCHLNLLLAKLQRGHFQLLVAVLE